MLRNPWMERICRYLLAAVFLMAGATKLLDLGSFQDQIVLHSRLPVSTARVVGVFLPWLELTSAFCLILNVAHREAAVVLGFLLLVFTGYLFLQPVGSECGCFWLPQAQLAARSRWLLTARNLFLLCCAVRVAWDSAGD